MTSEAISSVSVAELQDVIELVIDHRGKTPKKLGGDFTPTGVPVISAIHIKDGRINWSERERYVSEEMYQKWMPVRLREDDILLTSEAPLGEVALVPSDDDLVLSQRLFALRTMPDVMDSSFLKYFLSSAQGQSELWNRATGSTVLGIRQSELMRVRVPVPDLGVQQRAANLLRNLDRLIDGNVSISTTLESIAQTLFRSWFVDFDPVRAKMAGEKPVGMDDATAALFPDSMEESELGDIPAGWEWTPLDEIAEFLNGLALQKFPKEPEDPGLPAIKIAQLRAGSTQGADRVSSNIDSRFIVRDGDILFSWSGTLEVEVWAGGNGALNQHLFKVSGQGFPDWFAYFSTRVFLPEFRQTASSKATTMGHIQRKHLTESMVAVPGSELLQVANELIRPLFELKLNRIIEAKRLSNIRDSLLPRLISGELQIPEDLVA